MAEDGGLDPVIHAGVRLRITAMLAALAPGDGVSFTRLQQLLDATAGNLTTHLRKLEDARYVEITRTGNGRSAATVVCLTETGRHAFREYSRTLRALLSEETGNVPTSAG